MPRSKSKPKSDTIPEGPNKPVSMMKFVERVAEDVYRGQLMFAAQSILALPKNQAVVVTAYVVDQVKGSSYYSAFLRVLEAYFEG